MFIKMQFPYFIVPSFRQGERFVIVFGEKLSGLTKKFLFVWCFVLCSGYFPRISFLYLKKKEIQS